MSRLALRVVGTVVALVLPVTVAPLASADVWTHRDERRDVAQVQWSIPFDGFIVDPAPKIRHADATRVTVRHGSDRLRIRVGLRDVTRVWRLYRQVRARIVTPDATFVVDTDRSPGSGKPRVWDSERQQVSCPDTSFTIRFAADAVVLSVPTTCLGSPESLRVGVIYISTPGTVTYQDDPLTGRLRHVRDGRLSPWIAVGDGAS